MSQQGDVFLFQTNNGGDVIVENGVIQMEGGLEGAVYLSLFGGNEDCNSLNDCPFTWWGNRVEPNKVNKYVSETQFLLKSLPLITSNLVRITDAVKNDLNWLLENNIASSIVVTVTLPGVNKVSIAVSINAEGEEFNFNFVENWKELKRSKL